MSSKLLPALLTLACAMARAQSGSDASAVSERDFLGEVPVVLSVSRLAQPLDEAPGAVTILDRQFIRMSGARDVADLLRMVPGFQTTTSFETDAPLASYHGRSDDWANRIQVLVDGRSVYSGHLQGSAGLGLQTLALDDIARIEVLRGSNSAAYGARAFLGVINIVSRDVRETVGSSFSLASGDNGVADAGGSVGWGGPGAAYRVSMDSRGDQGLRGAYGRNRVSRLNASAAFDLDAGADVDVRVGALGIDAGRGTEGDAGNAARMRFLGSQFLQADWHTPLGEDQDLSLSYSHTENTYRDNFPYLSNAAGVNYFGIPIDFSAQEINDAVTLQHTVRASAALRAVWGAELRREAVSSASSFDLRGQVVAHFSRLFGNVEWRMDPQWVLNAGAMAEESNMGGGTVSPRLMLNWHAAPGHTLRAGVSSAFRPPSAYEKYAAVRYYDLNGQNPITTVQSTSISRRLPPGRPQPVQHAVESDCQPLDLVLSDRNRQSLIGVRAGLAGDLDVAAKHADDCKNAREKYQQSIQAHRIYKLNKAGEREYLSDSELDQARLNRDVVARTAGSSASVTSRSAIA